MKMKQNIVLRFMNQGSKRKAEPTIFFAAPLL